MNQIQPEDRSAERTYKLGVFWITRKGIFKKALIAVFILFDVALFAVAIWGLLDVYVFSYQREKEIIRELASGNTLLRKIVEERSAKPIMAGEVSSVKSDDGEWDLVAMAENPNTDLFVEFEYQFRFAGGVTDAKKSFLLPGEARPFMVFGFKSESAPLNSSLQIVSASWQRVDAHAIADYESWQRDRLNIEFSEIVHTPSLSIGEGGSAVSRTSFSAKNKSAFSYSDVPLIILLLRSSGVAGVNRVSISNFEANETRKIDVNWFDAVSGVSEVRIYPEINIFDDRVYIPLQGETEEDLRERVFKRS